MHSALPGGITPRIYCTANLGATNNDARWERLLRFYPEISWRSLCP